MNAIMIGHWLLYAGKRYQVKGIANGIVGLCDCDNLVCRHFQRYVAQSDLDSEKEASLFP